MKPGNFTLITEVINGTCVPLGIVDSMTTARRMITNGVKEEPQVDPADNVEYTLYRFTNGKPSYMWHFARVPTTGFWCWTKTYTRLWYDPTFSWKQLLRAGQK